MLKLTTFTLSALTLLAACSSDESSTEPAQQSTTTEAAVGDTSVDAAADAEAPTDEVADTTTPSDSADAEEPTTEEPTVAVDVLAGIGEVEVLGSGFGFAEGPAWDAGTERLVFSDVVASTIFSLTLDGEVATVAERPVNGIVVDSRGGFMAVGMSGQDLFSMSRDGATDVFVDSYEGASFNQPNDLVELVGAGFFFTDPQFGGGGAAAECLGVYFVTYEGELTQLLCDNDDLPNGIDLSPDNATLYIARTQSGNVTQLPFAADGSVGEESLFVETQGSADGMVVDEQGNLFVATSAGLEVFSSDGTDLGIIEFPEQPSNVTIGGPSGSTLFVTARTSIYTVELG